MNTPMPQPVNPAAAATSQNPPRQQSDEQKEGLWSYLKPPVIGGIILAVIVFIITLILHGIGGSMEDYNNQVPHDNPTHYQDGFDSFSGGMWQVFVIGMIAWLFIQVLRFWRNSK
jgi:predicted lipid-binding transport protein (Tim44 family)